MIYAQLLTTDLKGKVVETLGSFGVAQLDGRASTMWEQWGYELAQREQKAGQNIVGFEIRKGRFSQSSLLKKVMFKENT